MSKLTQKQERLAQAIGLLTHRAVEEKWQPLLERIAECERKAVPGPRGEKGEDGKSVDTEYLWGQMVNFITSEIDHKTQPLLERIAECERKAVPGPRGDRGEKGDRGEDGKSVDTIALHGLISELVSKAFSSLPVPKDGRDGRDGAAGRDALELEVVDLDPRKSYPRGTWASFRGGTFHATRQSDAFEEPIEQDTLSRAGWRCMLDGIHEEREEFSDEDREITKTTIWSSGKQTVATRTGRGTIWRGIYKLDVEYRRGDWVTYGGSGWYCRAEKSQGTVPGGGSEDWVLCVKKGDPGKSARSDPPDGPKVVKFR